MNSQDEGAAHRATAALDVFAAFASLVLLILFQLSASGPTPAFVDFAALRWKSGGACSPGAVPAELPGYAQSVGNSRAEPGGKTEARCFSDKFDLPASRIELEYVLASQPAEAPTRLEVVDSGANTLATLRLPASSVPGAPLSWKRLMIDLPPHAAGKTAQLQFSSVPQKGLFAVRSRLNIYSSESIFDIVHEVLSGLPMRAALCLVLAIFLFLWMKGRLSQQRCSSSQFALFLLLIAVVVHFRPAVFFYWDEWHVLQRFSELGFPGIVYTHNEHFLPLFFGSYYIEARLLDTAYLLYIFVSVLLHTANALLLAVLLRRLAGSHPKAVPAARLIAFLFVISALHSEVLHWAFEQAVLGCQTLVLLTLIFGLDAIQSADFRKIIITAFFAALAPLFFGNGFIVSAQLALLIALATPAAFNMARDRSLFEIFEERLRRGFVLLVLCAVFTVVPAVFYFVFQEGEGHGVAAAQPFRSPAALIAYIFVGSQLGAVLRGIGPYPALELGAASELSSKLTPLSPFFRALEPNLLFAYFGFGVSLVFLFIGLCSRDFVKHICLWLLGQLMIVLTLALPALGRWQFGIEQSLSLRYHSQTLVGLAVAVLPAILVLLGEAENLLQLFRFRVRIIGPIVQLVLVGHIALQLFMAANFTYFTEKGAENRRFVSQLLHWRGKLDELSPYSFLPYEAPGTALGGLQPLYPQTLTPGRHPDEIYHTLRWLR